VCFFASSINKSFLEDTYKVFKLTLMKLFMNLFYVVENVLILMCTEKILQSICHHQNFIKKHVKVVQHQHTF